MRRTYLFVFYLLIFSALFGLPGKATCQSDTVVRVNLAEVTLSPGESYVVEVWVDGVVNLVAFSVEIHFDQAYLSVDPSGLQPGAFLDFYLPEPTNGVNQTEGTISYGYAQGSSSDPVSGSGALFSFDITALEQPGSTMLEMIDVELVEGENYFLIECEAVGGLVQIIGDGFFVYLPLISN